MTWSDLIQWDSIRYFRIWSDIMRCCNNTTPTRLTVTKYLPPTPRFILPLLQNLLLIISSALFFPRPLLKDFLYILHISSYFSFSIRNSERSCVPWLLMETKLPTLSSKINLPRMLRYAYWFIHRTPLLECFLFIIILFVSSFIFILFISFSWLIHKLCNITPFPLCCFSPIFLLLSLLRSIYSHPPIRLRFHWVQNTEYRLIVFFLFLL